jgi:opacity protein-like surface antigen
MKTFKQLVAANIAGISLVCSPLLANEFSTKGFYLTGGIGASKINDVDILGTTSEITFENGLGIDLGLGYDFGKTRIEGTWMRAQSSEINVAGIIGTDDTNIDSLALSAYYDFRETKKWSPFVGVTLASTKVEINSVDDTGVSYGLALGVSYKTSDTSEVFIKSQGVVVPELDFGDIEVSNGNYGIGTIGVRYRF